jgi:porin
MTRRIHSKTAALMSVTAALMVFASGEAMAQAQGGKLGSGLADTASGPDKAAAAEPSRDPFGPAPSADISLANLAPMLFAFANNGPVFGLPGTQTGDFLDRTQLTGDWGGLRTRLARSGVFIDGYTTVANEDVTSGGLKTGSHLVVNTQFSLNVDTGRAGLWSGGLLHVTLQDRAGDGPSKTFTSGASVPSYYGLLLPEPTANNQVQVSEFYVAQALGPKVAVIAGETSNLFIPDQTAFANSYRYAFSNFAFNKNPMTPNFYQPTSLSVLAAWRPTANLSIAGGVLDPYTTSNNFVDHAFRKQNYYLMAIQSYSIDGLPGQFSPAFNWSNQPQLDLSHPFSSLRLAQIPQAIGFLVGGPDSRGLATNSRDQSWFLIANMSQYLWTPYTPEEIAYRLGTGQQLRGIGVIARAGYAPEQTNTVSRDASVALFARGVWNARPEDSIGAGFYYNGVSSDLQTSVSILSAGTIRLHDERGAEVFYDLALTPALHLAVSYQHIWDPLTATAATRQDHADIVTTRLTVGW